MPFIQNLSVSYYQLLPGVVSAFAESFLGVLLGGVVAAFLFLSYK